MTITSTVAIAKSLSAGLQVWHFRIKEFIAILRYATLGKRKEYPLQQHFPGVFNIFLDLDKELDGLPSVEQAVVICKRQIHHRANLDLSVDNHGAILDGVETQDSTLGQVDDGGSHQRAKDTAVADSKCAASHILNGELVVASLHFS